MDGKKGKKPQCECTGKSTGAEAQRTGHSQSRTAPHTRHTPSHRQGTDTTSHRQGTGSTSHREGVDNARGRKLECGDKAKLTDAQAKEQVYCKDHGPTSVTKKDQKK